MKLGILKSWNKLHEQYVEACEHLKVNFEVIDILAENWIEEIEKSNCDGFLCRPPCEMQERKTIFDEKIYYITQFMQKKIYPSFNELYIYENKRLLSYFLENKKLPHPKTWVLSTKEKALKFIQTSSFPLVFKTNIGASASGVNIIKNKRQAKRYIRSVFGFLTSDLSFGRIYFKKKKGITVPYLGAIQKHYIIAQEYYHVKHEWRIIKIGNYFSGHQKLLKGDFASGSGMVGWVKPPKHLLEMVRNISENNKFNSIAVDIFETESGNFLINEIQSLFGSYIHYQMKIDNIPGIYIYENREYKFIEGEFHKFASNELRIKDFISILEKEKY